MTFIAYIFSKNSWQILLAMFIFCLITFCGIKSNDWHKDVSWFDPLAGLGTLLLAAFLWINSNYGEWKNQLTKRLTVQFILNGKIIMEAKDTALTDLADVRPWALQIGQQISGSQRLLFEPYFEFNANGVLKDNTTNTFFVSYIIKYTLTALPDSLPEGICRIWTPVFNHDGSLRNINKEEMPLV